MLGLPLTAAHAATEKLIFDWNQPVTEKHRGFPRYGVSPGPSGPLAIDFPGFAEGTLYFRVIIRSQPVPQNMRLQWCAWQGANGPQQKESCGRQQAVFGASGTVVTWSQQVSKMWKKTYNGVPIPPNWSQPLKCHGIAFLNTKQQAVSDYYTQKWHGEDPKKWYPANIRFQVVIVQKGAVFGGWSKYGS
ncbi:MAG: hypothetical protein U1E45_16150 [Geminicoccaceae bacterium]